jgi:hypothetical protein
MPEPIPNPAGVPLLLLELQGMAGVALASAGLPPDLSRAPRPEEIASRTSYARMEQANLKAAVELGKLAKAARTSALQLVGQQLLAAPDVAGIIAQLDDLAGAVAPLTGAAGLIAETRRAAFERLVDQATTAVAQFLRDAHLAGIDMPGHVPPSAGTLVALDEQARRLGAESVAAALRAARGAAYSTARNAAVMARAQATGTLGLEDIAHQAALRATGEGRTDGVDAAPSTGITFYASELLDRNTCAECSSIDGEDLTKEQVGDLYPGGQYVACEGGGRCRGTVVAVSAIEVAGPAVPFEGQLPDL